jgi:hypothetical protein
MRIAIVALAAGLALAGCSEKTADAAASAAKDAASDTATNLDKASTAVGHAASKIGDKDDTSTASETTSADGSTTTTTTTTSSSD